MRIVILATLAASLFSGSARAQITIPEHHPGKSNDAKSGETGELTKEEKKKIAEAEKQRKKFPDWLVVASSSTTIAPVQTVGYVGWCGGNLSWIFCLSSPLTMGGGTTAYHVGYLESKAYEQTLECLISFFPLRRVALPPGRYPARAGHLGWIQLLANVDGKIRKVSCHKP